MVQNVLSVTLPIIMYTKGQTFLFRLKEVMVMKFFFNLFYNVHVLKCCADSLFGSLDNR